MKTEIANQAKNEVRELLDDYVVSPLDGKIRSALHSSEERLANELDQRTKSLEQTIFGQVGSLRTKIKENEGLFSNLEDQLTDVVQGNVRSVMDDIENLSNKEDAGREKLEAALSGMQRSLEEASRRDMDALREGFSSAMDGISKTVTSNAEATWENQKELESALTALKRQLETMTSRAEARISEASREATKTLTEQVCKAEDALAESSKASEELLTEKIQGTEAGLSQSIRETGQTLEDLAQQVDNRFSDLRQHAEENMEEFRHAEKGRMDRLEAALTGIRTDNKASLDEMKIEIIQYRTELAEQSGQQYKRLLSAAIIIGMADFLGIIIMVLLYFL